MASSSWQVDDPPEKPITLIDPNDPNMNAAVRKHLIRFKNLHVAPTRRNRIPMLSYDAKSGGVSVIDSNRQPAWLRNKQKKKANESTLGQSSGRSSPASSDSSWGCSSPTGKGSSPVDDEPVERVIELPSPSEIGNGDGAPIESIASDGVRVTTITGWEDDDNPFEPITMMSRKQTKNIQRRHPRHAIKRHAMYYVRLEKVKDPLNFYMEFIMPPPADEDVSWEESLQRFYFDPENERKYRMRTLRPYIGQMYAVCNKEAKKWERIRVHNFNFDKQTVYGMYLDRLQPFNDIPFNDLHELHPNYGNWAKYPLSGGLAEVRPPDYDPVKEEEKIRYKWPQASIDYFKNCTKDKLFRAFVVSKTLDKTDNLFHASDEDRFTELSVILFEVGAEHQIPVNAWMVQKGHAVAIKSMANWRQMAYDFHGMNLDIEKPEETEKKDDDKGNGGSMK